MIWGFMILYSSLFVSYRYGRDDKKGVVIPVRGTARTGAEWELSSSVSLAPSANMNTEKEMISQTD